MNLSRRAKSWLTNSRGEWYVMVQILLMLAVLFAGWNNNSFSLATTILGWILLLIGTGVSGVAVLELGKNLSPYPRPKNDSQLIERGAYSVVRHPIYCGIIFLAFGWSVLQWSLTALAFSIVLFFFFDLKARREERWLEEKFTDYPNYKKRVKKLIPFVY